MTNAASLWDLERAGSSSVTLLRWQERCHSLGSVFRMSGLELKGKILNSL